MELDMECAVVSASKPRFEVGEFLGVVGCLLVLGVDAVAEVVGWQLLGPCCKYIRIRS